MTETPLAANLELNFAKFDFDSALDCFCACRWVTCSFGSVNQPEKACDVLRKKIGMMNNRQTNNEIVKIALFINLPPKNNVITSIV